MIWHGSWEVSNVDFSKVTPDQLFNSIVVMLAIFAAVVTIDKFVDIIKKWRTPTTDTAKKLAMDKQRLDEHEEAITDLRESQQVICSALLAILDHGIHNGNTDQMEKARGELMKYLSKHIGN